MQRQGHPKSRTPNSQPSTGKVGGGGGGGGGGSMLRLGLLRRSLLHMWWEYGWQAEGGKKAKNLEKIFT